MFDITGGDIEHLNDADLRTLVAQLALAELRKQGAALSSVIAGGNQDAADGGIDVRVECSTPLPTPDFVPRPHTGFQVKKPDMPAHKIAAEMRPTPKGSRRKKAKGVLRQAIRDLAEVSGAYIIVSSQGSVAYGPLADRRKAIRDALSDLPGEEKLHTDFYDRDRLATWVNKYPGTSAWVRARIGRSLSGWSSVGDWLGTEVSGPAQYLMDDSACLIDNSTFDRTQLTIAEGIKRLRGLLRSPNQCVRLIGLSGLGKTRLVKALFETAIGEDPLDPSLAVYTDYSAEPTPTAHEMAHLMKQNGQPAILIIDNCNPATHTALAKICSTGGGSVSLITIEYDVRDDEPEHTDVFRLQSASNDLVTKWLKQSFPDISEIDCQSIADFSDGNFRIAAALAETLGKGESLGSLKSYDLFHRLFLQRNQLDQDLLRGAEDLSLFYSINFEDLSDTGELALIAHLRLVKPLDLYSILNELSQRGIAQVRGRWKAILPQAIANRLASAALKRIPPPVFDAFVITLTKRMQRSLSRRLGFLHDSMEARAIVDRWLKADGVLGDLISNSEEGSQIIANIAPAYPEAVLEKIKNSFDMPGSRDIFGPDHGTRSRWIHLIKELGYEADLFETAANLLARFVAFEPPDHQQNSAREAFAGWFHLNLSGTLATPEQRRTVVRHLVNSKDPDLRRCALISLEALLNTSGFMSIGSSGFGARSRGWGWQPTLWQEIFDWYSNAIDLTVELSSECDEVRDILAKHARGLWISNSCYDALDRAASQFVKVRPWLDGWLSFRATLSLDGEKMPNDVRQKLEIIIERLKPKDLLNQARATILHFGNGSWDVADGEADESGPVNQWEKAGRLAQNIGRSLATDELTRRMFLPELIASSKTARAFECGRGLAEGAISLDEIWHEIVNFFIESRCRKRDATVLGGFIFEAQRRDTEFVCSAMDAAVENSAIVQVLPYLQSRVMINEDSIARLRRTIQKGVVEASAFRSIYGTIIGNATPKALSELLLDIANMTDGIDVALRILHMYFHFDRQAGKAISSDLIEVGRSLLRRTDFSHVQARTDHEIGTIISVCCAGPEGITLAHEICFQILEEIKKNFISKHNINYILKALLKTQPSTTLDQFLNPELSRYNRYLFRSSFGHNGLLDNLDPTILCDWVNRAPDTRYPLLSGDVISMFTRDTHDNDVGISKVFVQLLANAPDKKAFLGRVGDRLRPRSWSGSLADILTRRKAKLQPLREDTDANVRQWVNDIDPILDQWINDERKRDRGVEEAFE